MYEMLAKRHPFEHARTIEALKQMHLYRKIPFMNTLTPKSILDLVMQCLAKDPAKRPNFSQLLNKLGIQEIPESDLDAARVAVEWNNKGKALTDLGDHRGAIECYVRALTLDPTNPIGWGNLAVSLSKIGLMDQADRLYEKCLSLNGVSAQMYANYAAHILRSHNRERDEEALSYCNRALELVPENLVALINKAALLNSLGRYPEAVKVAERAKEIDSSHPYIWVELGTAYLKIGRRSKARKCVKKALRLDPTFEPARKLENLLKGTL